MPDQRKSIVEEIRSGAYEASVVATFNAYFPFYEEVILPHLQNSGCRHNSILMDARTCGALLSTEGLRPRLAGKQYSLVPISCRGFFHPKLVLLLGKKRGLLLVGSHNLTLAGFSHNRELTNRFELVVDEDISSLSAFQSAWNFIASWSRQSPAPLQQTIDRIAELAPWLIGSSIKPEPSPLLTALPDGPSLWQQLREHLPKAARRITVIGPFFDSDFSFLGQLHSQYPTAELVVGIDPETVSLKEAARRTIPKAKFVAADGLGHGKGYLHAKALLLESGDGQETLVSGSANPSHPAWMLSASKNGNAEVVVVSKAERPESLAKVLGLSVLSESPVISDEVWKTIAQRKFTSELATGATAAATAFQTDFGIELFTASQTRVKPLARLIAADGSLLAQVIPEVRDERPLQLLIDDKVLLSKVALIEMDTENDTRLTAVLHHPIELAAFAQSDKERSLRIALDSLETDAPLLEDLMKLAEKMIFDQDFTVSVPSGKSETTASGNTKLEKVQDEFSISLSDTRLQKRTAQRLLSSGTLGTLLDALIHQLGIGLEATVRQAPGLALSEEELIDSEDEELVRIVTVDGPKLVALCQRKIKTILRRMLRQLENASASDSLTPKVLVQLAAVLGFVHRLSRVTSEEANWVPTGETLVPIEARSEFFIKATRLLYATNGVMKRALSQLENRAFEELSLIRGLLVWLAWDCGYEVEDPAGFEDPEDAENNIRGLSRLLALTADLHDDRDAMEKAQNAIAFSAQDYDPSQTDPTWFSRFSSWSNDINELLTTQKITTASRKEPEPGDIVLAGSPPRLFAVAQSFHNKVKVIDLDSDSELKPFSSKYVTIAKAGL